MDSRSYNQHAWNNMVERHAEFTQPANAEQIEAARQGFWQIYLSPGRPVPRTWFPELLNKDVLCLGAGGGQHAPILAAAGARLTVVDLSPRQLEQDRKIAEEEGLFIQTVEGDMASLSPLPDGGFDLIVQPVSNLYVSELAPLWSECYRVLRSGGVLIVGFMNPVFYIFDRELMDEEGKLQVRHSLPYSDLTSLSPQERQDLLENNWPLEWSHTLEEQIGGQIAAGFAITAFSEDRDERNALSEYLNIYCATRAIKVRNQGLRYLSP
jgi:SAM-dependent methyltransferase